MIDAQSEHVAHLGIESGERPPGGVRDQVIDRSEPPERAGRELDEQGAIAFVLQVRTRVGKGARKIGAAGIDGLQDTERRNPRASDHLSCVPAAIGRPARNSRAVIARFPSGCSSRMRRIPSPVATRIVSPAAARMVPGRRN